MRGSSLISFLGVAMTMGSLAAACGDDDAKPASPGAKSGEGESCTRTADCGSGLACFDNVCVEAPSGSGGSDGTGGSGGTGKGGTTAQPVLGGEGESCARRSDCEAGLGCFNQRCTTDAGGDAGGGNTPSLGSLGETCALSSDCGAGLACLPGGGNPGLNFLGVCTAVDTGLEPTGKTCAAECLSAADCCEIPLALRGTLGVNSCADLAEVLAPVNCNTTISPTALERCFADTVYCNCSTTTWQCTTSGQCVYNAACTADGLTPEGCPPQSRSGQPLTQTCDIGGTDKCTPPSTAVCSDDADCTTLPVADDNNDTCSDGECTCFEEACYRRCDEDLDCPFRWVCDAAAVCVPSGSCTEDISCVRLLGDYRATCLDGACTVPCETDLDCNFGGLTGGLTQLCSADGMCESVGCQSHDECSSASLHMFCTTPDPAAAPGVSSAITD